MAERVPHPRDEWVEFRRTRRSAAKPKRKSEFGYGGHWNRLRRTWQRRIDSGELIRCRRGNKCKHAETLPSGFVTGGVISPGDAWDLGHVDHDRSLPPAPEHAACNRATKAHQQPRRRPPEQHPGTQEA